MGSALVSMVQLRNAYTCHPNRAAVRARGQMASRPYHPRADGMSPERETTDPTAEEGGEKRHHRLQTMTSDLIVFGGSKERITSGDASSSYQELEAATLSAGSPQFVYAYTIPGEVCDDREVPKRLYGGTSRACHPLRPLSHFPMRGSGGGTARSAVTTASAAGIIANTSPPPCMLSSGPERSSCYASKMASALVVPQDPAVPSQAAFQLGNTGGEEATDTLDDDALGPLDCADAFTYFYAGEEAYSHVDSVVYRAAGVEAATPQQLSDAYIRGGAPTPEEQLWLRSPVSQLPSGVDGLDNIHSLKDCAPSAKAKARLVDNTDSLRTVVGVQSHSSPYEPCKAFTPLVEELRRQCVRQRELTALSWRRLDRVEQPGSSHPSDEIGAALTHHSDDDAEDGGSGTSLYYMGPRQSLTYGALWSRVEAFGWGLRSLGLRQGDAVGLLEDTRWEWVVTCYACWTQGYVPVVCYNTNRCLERFASDMGSDLKVVVCKPSAVPRMREHLRQAAGRAMAATLLSTADTDAQERVSYPPLSEYGKTSTCGEDSASGAALRNPTTAASVPSSSSNAPDVQSRPPGTRPLLSASPASGGRTMPMFITIRDPSGTSQQQSSLKVKSPTTTDEEEEALWWSDVLLHGEQKLVEARVKQHRELRQQRQRAQMSSATCGGRKVATHTYATPQGNCVSDASPGCILPRAPLVSAASAIPPIGENEALRRSHAGGATRSTMSHANTAPPLGGGLRRDHRQPPFHPVPLGHLPRRSTDLAMLVYTDGEPQGVMLTQGALKASAAGYAERLGDMEWLPRPQDGNSANTGRSRATYLAYRPMHNILELILQSVCLMEGVLVCYGHPETLLNTRARPHGDLQEYAPTILCAVPQFLEGLCATVERTLTGGYRHLLFEIGYEERRQALRRCLETPFLNRTVFHQPRQLLGGRCRLLLSCGAPLHPRVHEYIQVVCGTAVSQVYSLTEAAGSGLMQTLWSGQLDTIGGPLGPVEVKLRDVHHWQHQAERPSGELLLRGPVVMAGYYCQPERTAAALEGGGWLHTGDIAERHPDGTFALQGRLSLMRQTSAGHCVPLETLEAMYGDHQIVTASLPERCVCVLVNPYRPYICALVLTDERRVRNFLRDPATEAYLKSRGQLNSPLLQRWPYCLREHVFNEAVAASMRAHAKVAGVPPHERVRHVRVLYDTWTVRKGFRTATGRLQREAVEEHYNGVVAELFTDVL